MNSTNGTTQTDEPLGRRERIGLSDTSTAAQRVWDDVHRCMTIPRKWQILGQSQRTASLLARAGRFYRDADCSACNESEATMDQAGEGLSVAREASI